MNKTKEAFRLIVIRRPYQGTLFAEEGHSLKYTVIATNRIESAEDVVMWYNQRGECSENRIKELKIGRSPPHGIDTRLRPYGGDYIR